MKKIVIIFFTAGLFFILGVGTGYIIIQNKVNNNTETSTDSDYNSGWKALEKRAKESGRCDLGGAEVRVVSGKVTTKTSDSLMMNIVLFDPFQEPDLDERQVIYDDNTIIIREAVKGEEQYKNEIENYNASHSIEKDGESYYLNMPRKGFEEEIGFSDIKVGDEIIVRSGKDIRNSKKISAEKITIR